MVYNVGIELVKKTKDWKTYITNGWRINDLVHISLVLVMAISNIPTVPLISLSTQTVIASIASCSLLLKFFDWMRLFE